MEVKEVQSIALILERYSMNLKTVEWMLKIKKNPECTVSEIAENELDANNIRVGLRSRALSECVTKSSGISGGIGRPPVILSLNERGNKICEEVILVRE